MKYERRYRTIKESDGSPEELFGFTLHDEDYECRQINSLMMSHIMRMQRKRKDDPRSVAFIAEFFELVLGEDQYHTFLVQCMDEGITDEELGNILQDIVQAMTSGRPTGRRSVSSDGSPTTNLTLLDDSSSRVMHRLRGRPDLQMAVQLAKTG